MERECGFLPVERCSNDQDGISSPSPASRPRVSSPIAAREPDHEPSASGARRRQNSRFPKRSDDAPFRGLIVLSQLTGGTEKAACFYYPHQYLSGVLKTHLENPIRRSAVGSDLAPCVRAHGIPFESSATRRRRPILTESIAFLPGVTLSEHPAIGLIASPYGDTHDESRSIEI